MTIKREYWAGQSHRHDNNRPHGICPQWLRRWADHNIYIGKIAKFTITNSYIHDAIVGHEIKSRAAVTTIENNRIVDGTGNASYSIDLPNSGIALVKNNLIQQGPNSENRTIVSYGEEKVSRNGPIQSFRSRTTPSSTSVPIRGSLSIPAA